MNFVKVYTTINEFKKMANNVLGIIGLDVNSVLGILGNNLGDASEIIALLEKFKWILYIEIAIIVLDVAYIVIVALQKEKNWMLGSLVLVHIFFCIGVIVVILTTPSDILKLSIGPVLMIIVQLIFGELAGSKDLQEKAV